MFTARTEGAEQLYEDHSRKGMGAGQLQGLILQVWSYHNMLVARFLKTSIVPLRDCLVLLAISAVPLAVLELRKVIWAKR